MRQGDNQTHGDGLSYRLLRLRGSLYAVVFALIGGHMLMQRINRTNFDFDDLPDRTSLPVTLSDGSIRNGSTLTVLK